MKDMKFRVWDSTYNTWVSYSEYQCLPDDFVQFKDNNPLFELKGRGEESNRFVIEPCTGVKTADGKEIYVGDIVSTIYTEGDDKVGDVVYTSEVGAYRVRCKNRLLPIVTYRIVGNHSQGLLLTIASSIIGNIHENSNLLK